MSDPLKTHRVFRGDEMFEIREVIWLPGVLGQWMLCVLQGGRVAARFSLS